MPSFSRRRLGLAGLLALFGTQSRAFAQTQVTWPANPIKLIVPAPAGGGVDSLCRQLADKLTPLLGTRIIVENKAGAGGLIGAKAIAAAPADGYTIGYLHSGIATLQAMSGRIDLLKEFSPVSKLTSSSFVVAVHPDAPHRQLADLVKAMLAAPGRLTYGSGGIGSPAHLAFEHLRARTPGLDAVHVPFKGAIESANAVAGRELDCAIVLLTTALPLLQANRLRALAITTPRRSPRIPEVPTMAQSGIAGYEFDAWGGLFLPARTPDAIVARMHAAVQKIGTDAGFLAFVDGSGAILDLSPSPAAFREFTSATIVRESRIVDTLGLKGSS